MIEKAIYYATFFYTAIAHKNLIFLKQEYLA